MILSHVSPTRDKLHRIIAFIEQAQSQKLLALNSSLFRI
jgi:hypothetical protein